MRWDIPPLPQYSFMAWCSVKKIIGTLPLTFIIIIVVGIIIIIIIIIIIVVVVYFVIDSDRKLLVTPSYYF
jgi:hypothetical protein